MHLMLTGPNGSWKTALLREIVAQLEFLTSDIRIAEGEGDHWVAENEGGLPELPDDLAGQSSRECIADDKQNPEMKAAGVRLDCTSVRLLREKYRSGEFLIAFYPADRQLRLERAECVETVL